MRFMDLLDYLFRTSARVDSPTNSNTLNGSGQTGAMNFLTVQSLGSFTGVSAVIVLCWKALRVLDESTFASRWTPLTLSVVWLVVSLLATSRTGETKGSVMQFWGVVVLIGLLNTLVLFAATVGIS